MKRLLVVAVLVAAVSYPANAMLGPGGTQRMPGQGGSGTLLKCKANQYVYKGANGVVSCVRQGLMGATAPKSRPALIGGNGGLQILNTKGGVRVQCPAGQRTYVGSQGHVSCIRSGLMGATAPGTGGSGEQVVCNANQQRYVGANGHLSCIAKGSAGATAPRNFGPGGTQRMPGQNGGGTRRLVGQGGGSF